MAHWDRCQYTILQAMKRLLAGAAVVLCVAGWAAAQEAEPTAEPVFPTAGPPPTRKPASTPTPIAIPSERLTELAVFEGRWVCEGSAPDTFFTSAQKTRTTLTVQRDLAGFWYSGRAVQEKTADNPAPVTRLFYWGYDPLLAKFAGGWLDSRGAWSTQTSEQGWKDGEIEWLGHVTFTGEKLISREIFSKPANGRFTRRYEVLDFTTWVRGPEEECLDPALAEKMGNRSRPDPKP
jgi:hypothetical protein